MIAPVVVLEGRSQERCFELVATRRCFVAGALIPLTVAGFVVAVGVGTVVSEANRAMGAATLADPVFALCYAPLWPVLPVGQCVVWRSLTEPLVDAR